MTRVVGFMLLAAPGATLVGADQGAARQQSMDAPTVTCEQRIPELERATRETPQDAKLHNQLGICYQSTGQLGRAVREYQLAIKLAPKYAEAWNNLGTLEHGAGRFKKAVGSYRKAIERKADFAVAHKNMGTAYLAWGKTDQAITEFREALRIDPAILDASPAQSVRSFGDPAEQFYIYAKLNASAGQVDDALSCLAKAQTAGFNRFDRVRKDPDFKDVVKDPRFAALAAKS